MKFQLQFTKTLEEKDLLTALQKASWFLRDNSMGSSYHLMMGEFEFDLVVKNGDIGYLTIGHSQWRVDDRDYYLKIGILNGRFRIQGASRSFYTAGQLRTYARKQSNKRTQKAFIKLSTDMEKTLKKWGLRFSKNYLGPR